MKLDQSQQLIVLLQAKFVDWVIASTIVTILVSIVLSLINRWQYKKTMAVAPVVPAAGGEAKEEEEKNNGDEDEVQRMMQMLIEKEHGDVIQLVVRSMVNIAIVTLMTNFVLYATVFRRNDEQWIWNLILIGLLGLQSGIIHDGTQLTRRGIKFILQAHGLDTKPNQRNCLTRLKLWYRHYLDPKADGVYSELIMLASEMMEIMLQVHCKA